MNRLQLVLTKYLYIRPLSPKSQRIEDIRLSNGEEVEVILYSTNRRTMMVGQCTLFGTIIINEIACSSPSYLQRVVIHELSHKCQWYSYLAYPVFILFAPLAFMMLCITAGDAIYSVIFLDMESAIVAGILALVALAMLVVPCAYSWFIEYKAEAATFKRLGIDEVIEIDRKRPRPARTPLLWRIVAFLTHPPTRLSQAVYRHFNTRGTHPRDRTKIKKNASP